MQYLEIIENGTKAKVTRYVQNGTVSWEETTTFLREGFHGTVEGDPRLIRLAGVEGKWFWVSTFPAPANDISALPLNDPTQAWDYFAAPLAESHSVMNKKAFENQQKVTQKFALTNASK